MPDTWRKDFNNKKCDDCSIREATVCHNGPLTEDGVMGYFCDECFEIRQGSRDLKSTSIPLN